MKGLFIIIGESFKSNESYIDQINKIKSHLDLIRNIESKYNLHKSSIIINTNHTSYDCVIMYLYKPFLIHHTFNETILNIDDQFMQSINVCNLDYDFIIYINIDLLVTSNLIDQINPYSNDILYVDKKMIFIPKHNYDLIESDIKSYLSNSMVNKQYKIDHINLVVITSIIKPPTTPLSYTNNRSIYSSDERFEQTKHTIQSIKEKIPNCKILLVECSNLDDNQYQYLTTQCDYFINLIDNEICKLKCYSISKALGEATMTMEAINYINLNNIKYDYFFKISGRYYLSEMFDYRLFDCSESVIKYIIGYDGCICMNKLDNNIDIEINHNMDPILYNNYTHEFEKKYRCNICKSIYIPNISVLTCLYKLDKMDVIPFYNYLDSNSELLHDCIGYEIIFYYFIKKCKHVKVIKPIIGVKGYVSISTDFVHL